MLKFLSNYTYNTFIKTTLLCIPARSSVIFLLHFRRDEERLYFFYVITESSLTPDLTKTRNNENLTSDHTDESKFISLVNIF